MTPGRRGPWVMLQVWHDLLFAHWAIDPNLLQPLIAPPFTCDTFHGQAWVGVVPFWMSGVRARGLPPLPGLSTFPELNVRTYVRVGARAGVYFLSLDAGNPIAVEVARSVFHLPYLRARMRVERRADGVHYASQREDRRAPPAELRASYRPTGPVFHAAPGTLEHFLVERYCLYTTDGGGRPLRADIFHPPWPLQHAQAEFERETMLLGHGLHVPEVAPLLHFAARQEVRVWRPMAEVV